MTGTVSRVFLTRGFGFIVGDDGLDYFLHVSQVMEPTTWEEMRAGLPVTFSPTRTGDKANQLRAGAVRKA